MRLSSCRARLSDVAKLAGASSQTVSRVVRGASVVAPETRGWVLTAVEELGYRPNLATRSLSSCRTGVIYVVNATPLLGGHARTSLSIVSELRRLGYQTSVVGSPKDQNPALDQLVPLGVDGIMVLGGHAQSVDLVSMMRDRISAMSVGQQFDLPDDVTSAAIGQDAVARKATNRLLELGRRRLLYTCGPSDWFDAHERRDGFNAACRKAGIEPVKASPDSWKARSGYALGEHFPSDIDRLFTSDDHLAPGALRWPAEHDRAVPGDATTVGVDDVDRADSFLSPLTTIRQPRQNVRVRAVEHLTELTAGGSARYTILAPGLIIRESTKGH